MKIKDVLKRVSIIGIINFMLYLIIIFMPFIIKKNVIQIYVEGKVQFLYAVGILLLVFLVTYLIMQFIKIEELKIKWEAIIAIIFLFTIFVATIFSENKNIALWGKDGRNEGLLMYCVYIVIFLSSLFVFKIDYKKIKILLAFSCFMSFIGILQYFNIDIPGYILCGQALNKGQAMGTTGNANFFSSYICLFLFLSTALYIFKKEKIYLIYTLILFVGMIASQTRGGWLAYIIYLIMGLLFILKRKDCLKRAGILVLVFIVGFVGLSVTKGTNTIEKASISNVTNSKGTANQRIEIYKVCLKVIKDNPLLGNGPDTLEATLQNKYLKEYNDYTNRYNHYIDKAHNEILEYAANDGCLTAVLYLLLLGIIVVWLFKNRESDVNKILLLTVIGYFIQSQSNISVIQVAPLFWILLGYCVKRKYDYDNIKNKNNTLRERT